MSSGTEIYSLEYMISKNRIDAPNSFVLRTFTLATLDLIK